MTHAAPLIALARGLLGPKDLVRTGVCSVTKLVCFPDDVAIKTAEVDMTPKKGKDEKANDMKVLTAEGEKGEERKAKWVVEMNGYCDHLSKGEQYHWTF